jgi:hypothetical protein
MSMAHRLSVIHGATGTDIDAPKAWDQGVCHWHWRLQIRVRSGSDISRFGSCISTAGKSTGVMKVHIFCFSISTAAKGQPHNKAKGCQETN